jgi:hypothetical protein
MFSFFVKKAVFAVAILALGAGLAFVSCDQPTGNTGGSAPANAKEPVISGQPQGGNWNVGTNNTFSLTVTASVTDKGTLSYQWYSNTGNSTTGGSALGTNSASLTLNKTDYAENGTRYFYVVVTNTNNGATKNKTASVTSTVATVTVTGNGNVTGSAKLTDGVWKDGELTAAIRSAEYTFDVEDGKTYYVWWNSGYAGPTPKNKTLDIRVSAWYGDETTYIFGGVGHLGENTAWTTPQVFTAGKTGSVTMIVTPFNDNNPYGTFAVAFSTVSIRPGAAVAKTITVDQWKDDTISVNDIHVYTINVTQGRIYYVWWNDEIYGGDGSKTADVEVQARYADDTLIFNDATSEDGEAVTYADQWVDTAWATPQSFTADRNGTVDLRVRAFGGIPNNSGTYGIAYSTGSTRPIKDNATLVSVTANGSSGTPTTALTLIFNKAVYGLTAGDIALTLPGIFDVTKGALSGSGPTYTLGISSPVDGTLTVTVGGALLQITDPTTEVAIYKDNSIPQLVEDQWVYENLTAKSDVHWYTFDVSAGNRYYFWWDDDNFWEGERGDIATADIEIRVHANGAWVYGQYDWMDEYGLNMNATFSYAPDVPGTVYVWIRPSHNDTTRTYPGTYSYGIVYSTGSTRPNRGHATLTGVSANGSSGTPTTALTLTFNQVIPGLSATDITLTMPGLFGATKGALSGNGPVYTLGVSSPIDGTVTVAVGGELLQIAGSPKEVAVYGDGGAAIPLLVENQWADGEILLGTSVDWYKITVTANTTYRIWWNDEADGPTPKDKDGDVIVSAWYINGTSIFGDTAADRNRGGGENSDTGGVDSGWNTAQSFTPTANGTVYVRVLPYWRSSVNAGTYGIVFSTVNERPGS